MHLLSIVHGPEANGWNYWIWKDNDLGGVCGLEAHSKGPAYPSYEEALKVGSAALDMVDHADELAP